MKEGYRDNDQYILGRQKLEEIQKMEANLFSLIEKFHNEKCHLEKMILGRRIYTQTEFYSRICL